MSTPARWLQRTHTCGELRPGHAGRTVILNGWVHRRRDQGGLIFLDLRDRYGLTQVVLNRETHPAAHAAATDVRAEYVLAVRGEVRLRPAGTANPNLATGAVEVPAAELQVLAASRATPFEITGAADVDEAVRLKYRYLDLRRERIRDLAILRFRITRLMREYLWAKGFLELETPTLVKSTPEGARDFVVPSRHHPGQWYALPQSPQQMKQLLMVGGLDKYFQLARCYRDEDLRADRTAEFTQLDIEMAFIEREDILQLIEPLYLQIVGELSGKTLQQTPFPRLSYAEAIERYGSDRPDLRFGLELVDLSAQAGGRGFRVFDDAVAAGGRVKGLIAPGCAAYSRGQVDALQDVVKAWGAKGMVTIAQHADGSLRSPLLKPLGDSATRALAQAAGARTGDLVLIVADRPAIVAAALAGLRAHLGQTLQLINPNVLAFAWVLDFPLFEWKDDEQRFTFSHNPFCSPADDSFELLYTDPAKATSKQYDLVCNGTEIGGGSIRAHRAEDLHRVYEVMGYSEEQIQASVGHMLEALQFGAPPHGGIAMGLDRLAMILGDTSNLRDVTVFPMSQARQNLMLGAPSPPTAEQLAELHLTVRVPGTVPRSPGDG